jgi:hypothetical protein
LLADPWRSEDERRQGLAPRLEVEMLHGIIPSDHHYTFAVSIHGYKCTSSPSCCSSALLLIFPTHLQLFINILPTSYSTYSRYINSQHIQKPNTLPNISSFVAKHGFSHIDTAVLLPGLTCPLCDGRDPRRAGQGRCRGYILRRYWLQHRREEVSRPRQGPGRGRRFAYRSSFRMAE